MNTDGFKVCVDSWQHLEAACCMLREHVFIQEQQVPEDLEWDGLDEDAIHAIAYDPDGHAIATGRLLADGHIGRMAVLPEWRHKGVGSTILELLGQYSLERLGCKPWLDAQIQAVGFYRKHGYEEQGEAFIDAGIPHRHMVWAGNHSL